MCRWYVINTYSGHENKVKANLEHRIDSMGQSVRFRRVVVPTEHVIETKDGQKVQIEKRVLPGYVLVNMDLNDDAWTVVKNTPGVTGFVGAGSKPVPLSQGEVDRILKTGATSAERPRAQVEFSLGESVKVTSGPLSDFDGEIVDVNPDQQKLKVLVDIFERQGLGGAEPAEGRTPEAQPGALERREEAQGPERARRRPGGEDHRRHRAEYGSGGGALMAALGKRSRQARGTIDREQLYSPVEAIKMIKDAPGAKFD